MDITPKDYAAMQARRAPRSHSLADIAGAFGIGGAVCAVGALVRAWLLRTGLDAETAGAWTTVILVCASAVLTSTGLYARLAKHAGAGTLVPVTGFANAVSAAAIEARTEGLVLGVGAKAFTIAGPVILYGTAAASACGLVYWLVGTITGTL